MSAHRRIKPNVSKASVLNSSCTSVYLKARSFHCCSLSGNEYQCQQTALHCPSVVRPSAISAGLAQRLSLQVQICLHCTLSPAVGAYSNNNSLTNVHPFSQSCVHIKVRSVCTAHPRASTTDIRGMSSPPPGPGSVLKRHGFGNRLVHVRHTVGRYQSHGAAGDCIIISSVTSRYYHRKASGVLAWECFRPSVTMTSLQ